MNNVLVDLYNDHGHRLRLVDSFLAPVPLVTLIVNQKHKVILTVDEAEQLADGLDVFLASRDRVTTPEASL